MREKKLEEVKNFVRKHSHKIVAITCLTSGYILGSKIAHNKGYDLGFRDGSAGLKTILTGDYDDKITITYF